MPRPRIKRQLCDCITCSEPNEFSAPPQLAVALARQEPPPKSLIIIVNGVLCTAEAEPEATSADRTPIPHLDTVAREGSCGILACVTGEQENEPLEAQILRPAIGAPHSLKERFKDMHATLIAGSAEYEKLGRLYGFQNILQLPPSDGSKEILPNIDDVVHQVITALRISPLEEFVAAAAATGSIVDEDESDMAVLMLRIGSEGHSYSSSTHETEVEASCKGLVWLDSLVRALDAVPGFKDVCLLSLVLGACRHTLLPMISTQRPISLQSKEISPENNSNNHPHMDGTSFSGRTLHPPLQSYQFRGPEKVDVDASRPAIVIHRLAGIVRRDRVQALSLAEIRTRGGGGCILAERMLTEVAYKIGRAPKYGA